MSKAVKKYKNFEKSGKEFDDFYGPGPIEVDQETVDSFNYWKPWGWSDGKFYQESECNRELHGTRYYRTFESRDGRYFYLGVLPEFKNED